MSSNILAVETTAGSTLLGRDNPVYVRINNKVYFKKKASELQEGDVVLYESQYVKKDLSEIIPYLMESPRYRYATQVIFEENSEGKSIPRLRINLWKGIKTEANLEQRIMLEGNRDFSPEEYDEALDRVYGSIGGDAATITKGAVKLWLNGKTKSPLNKNLYFQLAQINPVFLEWYISFNPGGPYIHYYDLWERIHQGVMRYLSRRKGLTQASDENILPEVPISLAPEIKEVLKNVIGEVNDETLFARVTKLDYMREKGIVQAHEKFDPHLERGVYHKEEVPYKSMRVKTITELRYNQRVLESILLRCFQEVYSRLIEEDEDKPTKSNQLWSFQLLIDGVNKTLYQLTGSEFYGKLGNRVTSKKVMEYTTLISEYFLEGIKTGALEDFLELPAGQIKEATDAIAAINRNMPYLYFMYTNSVASFINGMREMEESLVSHLSSLEKIGVTIDTTGKMKINSTLKYNTNMLMQLQSQRLHEYSKLKKLSHQTKEYKGRLKKIYGFNEVNVPTIENKSVTDYTTLKEAIEAAKDIIQEIKIPRDDLQSVLEDYGVGSLMKYYDPNLIDMVTVFHITQIGVDRIPNSVFRKPHFKIINR